jgi:hypothetical protein
MEFEKVKIAAKDILDDRLGADFYKDSNLLASYLEYKLCIKKEKADHIAKIIQEDRTGANYYREFKILESFLCNALNEPQ